MKKKVKFIVQLTCYLDAGPHGLQPWNGKTEGFDTYEEAEQFILNEKPDLSEGFDFEYSIQKVWVIDE